MANALTLTALPAVGKSCDICHLFSGHELRANAEFTIEAKNISEQHIKCSIQEVTTDEMRLFAADSDEPLSPQLALRLNGSPSPLLQSIPLTRRGGLRTDVLELGRRTRRKEGSIVEFIPTESLTVTALVNAWNKIVLTEDEGLVLRALRNLEPKIEKIAAVVDQPSPYRGALGEGGISGQAFR